MKKLKRMVSLLLALVMAMSLCSVTAWATRTSSEAGVSMEVNGTHVYYWGVMEDGYMVYGGGYNRCDGVDNMPALFLYPVDSGDHFFLGFATSEYSAAPTLTEENGSTALEWEDIQNTNETAYYIYKFTANDDLGGGDTFTFAISGSGSGGFKIVFEDDNGGGFSFTSVTAALADASDEVKAFATKYLDDSTGHLQNETASGIRAALEAFRALSEGDQETLGCMRIPNGNGQQEFGAYMVLKAGEIGTTLWWDYDSDEVELQVGYNAGLHTTVGKHDVQLITSWNYGVPIFYNWAGFYLKSDVYHVADSSVDWLGFVVNCAEDEKDGHIYPKMELVNTSGSGAQMAGGFWDFVDGKQPHFFSVSDINMPATGGTLTFKVTYADQSSDTFNVVFDEFSVTAALAGAPQEAKDFATKYLNDSTGHLKDESDSNIKAAVKAFRALYDQDPEITDALGGMQIPNGNGWQEFGTYMVLQAGKAGTTLWWDYDPDEVEVQVGYDAGLCKVVGNHDVRLVTGWDFGVPIYENWAGFYLDNDVYHVTDSGADGFVFIVHCAEDEAGEQSCPKLELTNAAGTNARVDNLGWNYANGERLHYFVVNDINMSANGGTLTFKVTYADGTSGIFDVVYDAFSVAKALKNANASQETKDFAAKYLVDGTGLLKENANDTKGIDIDRNDYSNVADIVKEAVYAFRTLWDESDDWDKSVGALGDMQIITCDGTMAFGTYLAAASGMVGISLWSDDAWSAVSAGVEMELDSTHALRYVNSIEWGIPTYDHMADVSVSGSTFSTHWDWNEFFLLVYCNDESEAAPTVAITGGSGSGTVSYEGDDTFNQQKRCIYYVQDDWQDVEHDLVLTITYADGTTKNVTIQFNKPAANIIYDLDGGTNDGRNPTSYDYGCEVKSFADPTREGYTFAGWVDADGNKVTGIPANTVGDVTLKATWTVNQYSITFKPNNGEKDTVMTQDYGTDVTAPTDPIRGGWTFAGWDTTVPATMPAKDTTITAKWRNASGSSVTVGGDTSTAGVIVAGNTATVESTEGAFASASGNVTIDASSTGASEVTISGSAVSEISGNNNAGSLTITTATGSVEMGKDVLNTMSDKGDMSVKVEQVNKGDENLTDKQKETLEKLPTNSTVIEVTMVTTDSEGNEKEQHDLGGNVKVTVEYDAKGMPQVIVCYIDDEGKTHYVQATYDRVNKKVTFTTNHFSHYVVYGKNRSSSATVTQPSSPATFDAGVGIYAALAVSSLMGMGYMGGMSRKNKKNS